MREKFSSIWIVLIFHFTLVARISVLMHSNVLHLLDTSGDTQSKSLCFVVP